MDRIKRGNEVYEDLDCFLLVFKPVFKELSQAKNLVTATHARPESCLVGSRSAVSGVSESI